MKTISQRLGALLVLLALAAAAQAADEPKTFLGLKLGAPLSVQTVPVCLSLSERSPPGHDPFAYCRMAGVLDSTVVLRNVLPEIGIWDGTASLLEGRVAQVSIVVPGRQRLDALSMLKSRYGEADQVSQQVYRNLSGTLITGTIHLWRWDNLLIALAEGDPAGAGKDELMVMTRAWIQQRTTDRSDPVDRAAGKL